MTGVLRQHGPHQEAITIDRAPGVGGELALRRAGEHFEIISNGVFLMDTRNGESERLLVRAALDSLPAPASVLIGGLGVGFSLAEAAASPAVTAVTVIERESAVIAWHATHLRPYSAGALRDPRVRLEHADLLSWLPRPGPRFDAICLDIDNGPEWTVTAGNAALYRPAGLELVAGRLTARGTLAVWSASASPAFERLLRARFAHVTVRRIPVPRGEPDVVYLASYQEAG